MKSLLFFKCSFLLFLLLLVNLSKAQHLWYPDNKNGDIIMNEVMVTNTTPCSYWETMGWNVGAQGGAYCGIQQSASGTNFIFSIWDPIGTTTPITAPYKLPGSNVEKFGGEGTGLHYDDKRLIGWKLNTWVRTVARRWDYNGHSFFGFWSYDYGTTNWTHHVTMDFPVANVNFNSGSTNSFLEDWCGSPQNYRKGLYKNGYKRAAGSWLPWGTASYSGNGSSTSDNKANAGIENGAYFMEFGGSAVKTVSEGQVLKITLPAKPVLTIGQVSSIDVSSKADSLSVTWVTDKTKSPQFSYTIKLIDGTGKVVLTKTDIVPHLRKLTFSTKNLASGTYTVNVSIVDIFDQVSNEVTKSVVINNTTGMINIAFTKQDYFIIYPNPCKDIVNIAFMQNGSRETTISIYDITGRVIMENKTINTAAYNVDVSMLKDGIYFIAFFDENKKTLQHLKLIKEQ